MSKLTTLTSVVPCREKDPDPEGKQLAATKDPLGEATKLVQRLKQYAGDRLKTHLFAFEVGLLLCSNVHCALSGVEGCTEESWCMVSLSGHL